MAPYFLTIFFMLAVLSPLHVVAYPDGKVQSSCSSMEPSHGSSAQISSAPYSLVLSKSTYSAGERITVTLSSNEGASAFTGFLIQARSGSATTPLGSFETSNANTQTLTCTNSAAAVSHTSKAQKSSIQVTWVAPNTNTADIQLRATVVQTEKVYWSNVVSAKLSYSGSSISSTTVSSSGGSTSGGSTSGGSTSRGSTSRGSTSGGSTSGGSTSGGSTSRGSTSGGSTSGGSTSGGSTSRGSTSGGQSNNRGLQFFVPALPELMFLAFITVAGII